MNEFQSKDQRVRDLLADQALSALTAEEQVELRELLAGFDVDPESFERAAALAAVALNPGPFEPLPAALTARIAAAAAEHLAAASEQRRTATTGAIEAGRRDPNSHSETTRGKLTRETITGRASKREVIAWFMAAACLLVAAISWWLVKPSSQTLPTAPTVAEARKLLMERAPDLVQAPWTSTDDPTAKGATGDVVWSNAKQEGFLRFKGLAANDPRKDQYQLWIFDANQDERYPIDGGVFDVDPSSGDVIVPIHAKLRVIDPKMFAVTVEKPGGVVVSSRKRISLLAKTPATQG